MTVHMYRIHTENPADVSLSEAKSLVQNWLDNNTPWTEDPVEHTISIIGGDELSDQPEHYYGNARFEFTDAKSDLTSEIENALQPEVSWYRIGYHECSHDEANAGACSWDDQIDYGTVPSSIPTYA